MHSIFHALATGRAFESWHAHAPRERALSSTCYAQLLKEILESKEEMGDTMRKSFFSMTEAKYAAGDNIKHTIFDNVDSAQVRCWILNENGIFPGER